MLTSWCPPSRPRPRVVEVLACAERAGVVFDVVYDPWPTPLARFARETGRVLVAGLDLLVHQAVLQVELMTGVPEGPLDAMRAAGEQALEQRGVESPGGQPVTTWFLDTALVAGAVGLVAGGFVPELIARLPEPTPEPEGEGLQAAEDEASFAKPVDEPKELYVDIAATPRLRWWTAAASAVAAGLLGARVGWHPALLFLVYLVPVCVALSVVDWRTRYLPTRLIAPSYVVVGVLAVLASALTGDWAALQTSVVGWLASFAVFWLLWFMVPRGMAYGDVRLAGLLGMALGWLGVGTTGARAVHGVPARWHRRAGAQQDADLPPPPLPVRPVPGARGVARRGVHPSARGGVRLGGRRHRLALVLAPGRTGRAGRAMKLP